MGAKVVKAVQPESFGLAAFHFLFADPRTGGRSRFFDDTRTWPPQKSWALESEFDATARRRSKGPLEFSRRFWIVESGFVLLSSVLFDSSFVNLIFV